MKLYKEENKRYYNNLYSAIVSFEILILTLVDYFYLKNSIFYNIIQGNTRVFIFVWCFMGLFLVELLIDLYKDEIYSIYLELIKLKLNENKN